MTTIQELVTEAFRENNLVQVGDTPEGAEYLEAESLLLRYITSLFGTELGEPLTNVVLDASSDSITSNSRVVVGDSLPASITLSSNPADGEQFAVVDPRGLLAGLVVEAGEGTIEGAESVTLDTSASEYSWFYRADKADWSLVSPLSSESESPLPEEFDELLTLWLAIKIAPRTGAQTKPESIQAYQRVLKKFKARYKQGREASVESGLLNIPSSRYFRYVVNWATGEV